MRNLSDATATVMKLRAAASFASDDFWRGIRAAERELRGITSTRKAPRKAAMRGIRKNFRFVTSDRNWPGLGFVDTVIGLKGRPERMVPHGRPSAEIPA